MNEPRRCVTSIAAVVLMTLFPQQLIAQDEDLVVRAASDPEKSSLVGQRIRLSVDVLARDVWANLPHPPRIEVPGAVVVAPPNSSVRLTERIDGSTFIGQRYEFWIYPQRKGELRIPSLDLDVQLKPLGFGKEAESKSAQTESMTLQVSYPEGVKSAVGFVCADEFSVQQSWQPKSGDLKVGDGITRTITRVVSGTPAMALAPFESDAISGVRIYPKQPDVEDQFDRGSLTGKRTDRFTYIFEQAGTVELPEVKLSWLDLEAMELKTEVLDGLKVDVQPAEPTAASSADAQQQSGDDHRGALWALAGLFIAVGLVVFFRESLWILYRRWHERFVASEASVFRHFVSVARTNHPEKTLRALIHWWDVADQGNPAPRLDLFLADFGSQESSSKLAELERAVDAESETWKQGNFVQQIRNARRGWMASCRRQSEAARSCLPPMNPGLHVGQYLRD